jgi:small-conductance mechanosensitive channel
VTIRRMTGETVIVPNKNFTSSVLQNIDARPSYMTRLPVPISSRTPADKVVEALKILHEIAATAPMLEKVHYVNFDKIPGDGSYVLDLWIKTKKWKPEEKDTLQDDWTKIYLGPTYCLTEIVRRFNEAGIEFARPLVPVVNAAPSSISAQNSATA